MRPEEPEEERRPDRPPPCAICQQRLDTRDADALACGHAFHAGCADRWLLEAPPAARGRCPVCRSRDAARATRARSRRAAAVAEAAAQPLPPL